MSDKEPDSATTVDSPTHQHKKTEHPSVDAAPKSDDFSLGKVFGDKDPSVDLMAIWKWIVKHKALFLIIIPLLLSIYVRSGTKDMPIASEWATSNIQGFIKSDIQVVISAQYPNLPDASKSNLVDQQYARALQSGQYTIQSGSYRGQTMNINDQISKTAEQLKAFWQYDLNGKQVTYMPDIDPYFWMRYARNYLEKGMYGDVLTKDGQWLDNHMIAPHGKIISIQDGIMPIFLAWNYRVFTLFTSNTDLMQASSWFPVIVMVISIIPAFMFGRRIAGDIGGFFTACVLAVNLAGISRTLWGHPDTDVFNLLFPMLFMWIMVETLCAKKLWSRITLAALAALTLDAYAVSWSGWWYVFDFTLGGFALLGAWLVIEAWTKQGLSAAFDPRKNRLFGNLLIIIGVFLIVQTVGGIIYLGEAPFSDLGRTVSALVEFSNIKDAAKLDLWPNVYTTVAEMNPGSVDAAISAVGGLFVFVFSLIGAALLFVFHKERREARFFTAFMVLLWFIGAIYATTKGIRFTLLMVPPVAIGIGALAGLLNDFLSKISKPILRVPGIVTSLAFIVLMFILFVQGPIAEAQSEGAHDVPIMNDAWWTALSAINQTASKDAIINSWWDFGHQFKYVADRAVTADGASQNGPEAHWIGLALLTDNEKLATGILRMLDCGGGRDALPIIEPGLNNTAHAVEALTESLTMSRADARQHFLDHKVPESQVDALLDTIQCNPPEDYFITSEDMIGKSGVWGHFGSWDFERAYAYIKLKDEEKSTAVADLMDSFNYTQTAAESMYDEVQTLGDDNAVNSWISQWPGYLSGLSDCSIQGQMLVCSNGFMMNATSGDATIQVQGNEGHPASVVYIDGDGKFAERTYNESTIDVSAALIPTNGGFQSILMSPILAKSMFTRLYFFKGQGLTQFDLFNGQHQLTGGDILVWKVDWQGHAPNQVFTKAEPPIQKAEKPLANETTNKTVEILGNTTLNGTNASS